MNPRNETPPDLRRQSRLYATAIQTWTSAARASNSRPLGTYGIDCKTILYKGINRNQNRNNTRILSILNVLATQAYDYKALQLLVAYDEPRDTTNPAVDPMNKNLNKI